ncbi:hypothetical protein [Aestuariibaculum suncheonense]|uniref:Lipoprotein n=1 Tax=Aestuariibaculum suncheonense TaxID=1028745 RepID=A0A8J6QFG9_9FLAO|nr:hypothetical protein [Aestuariibaculum suncheonense]MBD0835242.1 hypothetical protein [Aestuariibaculum suncheonense]
MKKSLLILPFFLLTILGCKAQDREPSDFIPKGYAEFEKYFGDLNKDGLDDCVLIIKKTDTANIVTNRFDKKVDRNRRGIVVLFKKEKGYELADKNYSCFSSENEDGGVYFPPELWIDFERGNLIVHYGHGRYGFWRYIFRFQNSNFELIGYDESNGGVVISSETSINFLTKKKLIRENTNENAEGGDEVFKETWDNIEIEALIKLSEIKDFDELEVYNY